ncbi:MAG: hypothetical protein KGL39_35225 [Patescibacteria group bacterium]|nr:hypothetical protein [Patescibacteria group bacterium]
MTNPDSETDTKWHGLPPRQITGKPYWYYGYVQRGDDHATLRHCHEGMHRGRMAAQRCEVRAVRRLNHDQS